MSKQYLTVKTYINKVFGSLRAVFDEETHKVLFNAKDVATALGYAKPVDAVRTHCKGVCDLKTPSAGGPQMMKFIPESDVYRLVMSSKLPNAEKFQDWVCEEVLPSIRKNGGYIYVDENTTYDELTDNIKNTTDAARDKFNELQERCDKAEAKIKKHEQVIFMDERSKEMGYIFSLADVSSYMNDLGFDCGVKRLNRKLWNAGFYRRTGQPFQEFHEFAANVPFVVETEDGRLLKRTKTMFTYSGIKWIETLFQREEQEQFSTMIDF